MVPALMAVTVSRADAVHRLAGDSALERPSS